MATYNGGKPQLVKPGDELYFERIEYKSEIIEAAADKLAERSSRTKAAKEILEDNRRFEKAYDYQPFTDYNNMMKEEDK